MPNIIVRGLPVNHGKVTGKITIVKNVDQLYDVEEGDIMVVPTSHPSYAIGVLKASGLICEVGGRLSHLCIVAMEMGIPCITQAENAVTLLEPLSEITLNASTGEVYEI